MAAKTKLPESKGTLPKDFSSGFFDSPSDGLVFVVVFEIDHDTTRETTAKGNTTIGTDRQDMVGTDGKTYTFSGLCYRHDRKK